MTFKDYKASAPMPSAQPQGVQDWHHMEATLALISMLICQPPTVILTCYSHLTYVPTRAGLDLQHGWRETALAAILAPFK